MVAEARMRSGKGGSGGGDELDDEDVEGMDQFEGEERDDGLGKLVRPTNSAAAPPANGSTPPTPHLKLTSAGTAT